MKLYKRTLMRLFFVIEVIVFVGVYIFGGNGLHALSRLSIDNNKLNKEILDLKNEVAAVERQIDDWKSNDFYKEKVAREQLQMVKKGDEVYFFQ